MKFIIALLALLLALPVSARNPRGAATGSGSTPTGTWVNVTPSNMNLTSDLTCTNYGDYTVQTDPNNPSNLYTEANCQGIWKSTDYGQTWTGPINTGTNGSTIGDCAGGITLLPTGTPPTIVESCIRGAGLGFWVSTDGGVDWTNHSVGTTPDGLQDVYPASVDPYNAHTLLMTGHEMGWLGLSTNTGSSWSSITLAAGMGGACTSCGTAFAFFVDTGNATTTAQTWLWIEQITGGTIGTWKTTNSGSSWTQVSAQEHAHGLAQLYQPGGGVVYEPGQYSSQCFGGCILRSADYGSTWAQVGVGTPESLAWGDPYNLYGMYGWACDSASQGNCGVNPALETALPPGTGTWTQPGTPSGMTGNGAGQVAVTNDGVHNIFVAGMWTSGLWRYIEPVTTGTWVNVTPNAIDLVDNLDCGNYGSTGIQGDPSNLGVAYTQFNCQGLWKTSNYGQTWTGPVNTGTNGATVGDCAGGITVIPNATPGGAATIFTTCKRGGTVAPGATGLWKSTDNGVDWVQETVAGYSGGNGFYPPVVDPYDSTHLLMAGHETNVLFESMDGGTTWTMPNVASGLVTTDGTLGISFINTGSSTTTRTTWLGMAPLTGGTAGTWRTTNSGTSWTQVTNGEHGNGDTQTYQPDTSGKFYIAEQYASAGDGIEYSTDYGQTWTHVGNNLPEAIAFGDSKDLYGMWGYAIGPGMTTNPSLEIGAFPGTGSWSEPGTPTAMTQGPAQAAVLFDGTHNIILTASYNAGVWRYVEP